MAHTRATVGSSLPTTTDKVGEGPTNFEDLKTDLVERWGSDHYINNSNVPTDGDYDGNHKKVTMKKITAPTALVDTGILYTKDVSGVAELHYKEDSVAGGSEIQITSGGSLNIPDPSPIDSIFSAYANISGSMNSTYTIISYPSGYTKSNSILVSGRVTDGDNANRVVIPNIYSEVSFRDSDILITQYSSQNYTEYRLIIGKMI